MLSGHATAVAAIPRLRDRGQCSPGYHRHPTGEHLSRPSRPFQRHYFGTAATGCALVVATQIPADQKMVCGIKACPHEQRRGDKSGKRIGSKGFGLSLRARSGIERLVDEGMVILALVPLSRCFSQYPVTGTRAQRCPLS